MELVKVTNIGLKMSDDTVIPVIRGVIRDYATNISQVDANSLMYEIYTRSLGMVSTCSYYTSDRNAFVFNGAVSGTVTHGDNTGFECQRTMRGSGTRWQQCDFTGIWYLGTKVAAAPVFTGYSTYEYCYAVILTDEDYNLIYSTGVNKIVRGIQIRSSENLGITESNDMCIGSISQSGEYHDIQPDWILTTGPNIFNYITQEIDPTLTDPYNPGGNTGDDETEGQGGTGDFDGTSDSVDFPNLPNLSAVDTGFITLFNPSASQLKSLANYMWSGLFDLDTFKKIFADPMDCILGLSIVPVNVPSSGSDTVKVGNISTGVSMTKAASQYVSVDCGTLNVNEFWGAYLDYSPYTKAEIYLPYVGTHPLDIDDIMNKPVHVKYHIDILSGACIAFVKCGDSVLYSFIGQCSSSIPITGNDWTNVINGVINIAGAVGSMVMTGGMSAPMAIGQIASTAVNSSKPSVEKSGSLSGTGGMLGVQTPYMILTRPRQALPAQQNVYTGYPSFITRTLSSVSGYTEVDHIHLENVPGTESELSEIESLLKMGVIF